MVAGAAPIWFIWLASHGALYMSTICLRLLAHFVVCLHRSKDLRRCYGSWALITGPTTSLGRSMAMELACQGLNLILLNLHAANLHEISSTLHETHPEIQTKTVVFDLSLAGTEAMQQLRDAIEGLDVGVLVNNAAVARPGALFVHEADVERLVKMVRVNVTGLTVVTKAVLPGMLERGRGAVVNVGSGSTVAVPSFPLYTVYSATKRSRYSILLRLDISMSLIGKMLYLPYLRSDVVLKFLYMATYMNKSTITNSLLRKLNGVSINLAGGNNYKPKNRAFNNLKLCQVPFYVHTGMLSPQVKATMTVTLPFVATADAYARDAARWIGYGGAFCVPDASQQLQWFLAAFVPDAVHDWYRLRQHLNHRAILRNLNRS
ncbi:hypothetical protein BRADI_5g01790v3 [Brachypodium distachyon]|uniref:Uncharacterized protein n=1 Tax=Brachypodium distachyon TaxID=15368 RepID=A0A0Q3E5X5_BRADI|nr:hypothetical protein BRADI_5g01790v3 [Brachypodium distachyon]